MLTPRQSFNLLCVEQLHRIAQIGVARSVSFTVPRAVPNDRRREGPRSEKERSRHAAYPSQVHRSNRRDYREMTERQRQKHLYNQMYQSRKRAERELLALMAKES